MTSPRGLVLGLVLVLVLVLGLGGCVTMPNTATSYVASASPTDNQVIASAISSYLGSTFPPGRTTLIMQPVASGSSALLDQLSADLRAQGFGVTSPAAGAVGDTVRLVVASAFGGYVVRLDYGGQEAGTFFGRDTLGILQSGSPFVVREAAQ